MIETLAYHPYFLFALMMGGAVASFCCVVVDRAGTGEGLGGRSHCACGRLLKPWENIPLLGWLRVGGKAPCCGQRIPSWYVHAELAGAVVWGVAAWYGVLPLVVALIATVATTAIAYRARLRNR